MKNWFAAVLAGVLVIVVGSAIASVPGGSNTNFNVADPAVTVIASGQSKISTAEGSPNCHWEAENLTFCPTSELTFTPKVDAICQVDGSLGFVGEPMAKEAGLLDGVLYGIGLRTEGVDSIASDENRVGVTPNYLSMATMHRTRLIPVKAGVEYVFEPYILSEGESTGTLYWDASYVCFG